MLLVIILPLTFLLCKSARVTAAMCFAKEFASGFSVSLVKLPLFLSTLSSSFQSALDSSCTGQMWRGTLLLHCREGLRGEKMSCASACVGILWQSRDLGPNFVSCLRFSCKISPSCFSKLFTACFVAHFCFKFGDSLLTFTCESACNRRIQAFLTTPRVSAAYLLCP